MQIKKNGSATVSTLGFRMTVIITDATPTCPNKRMMVKI
jgi:hypothetical protein